MTKRPTTTPPQRIYNKIIQELGFPHPIPEQLGITLEGVQDAYNQCIARGLTIQQAEQLILKMWTNAGK